MGAVDTAWQSLLRPGNGSGKNWQMRVNIQEIIIAGNLLEKVEHVCLCVCLGGIFHTQKVRESYILKFRLQDYVVKSFYLHCLYTLHRSNSFSYHLIRAHM